MLVVNLFGAPGAGKSTGAAYIFSKLKMAGVNAELVTEFAKDKVWEESKAVFQNQAYIFGKQYFRISRVQDKVDVVITDSPILLSSFYANDEVLGEEFDALIMKTVRRQRGQHFYRKPDRAMPARGWESSAQGVPRQRIQRQEHRASRLPRYDGGGSQRRRQPYHRVPARPHQPVCPRFCKRHQRTPEVWGGVRVHHREVRYLDPNREGHADDCHGVRPA